MTSIICDIHCQVCNPGTGACSHGPEPVAALAQTGPERSFEYGEDSSVRQGGAAIAAKQVAGFVACSAVGWLKQPRPSASWAVNEVVIGAGVASIGRGGIVLGVGVCVGADGLECLGAGGGIVAWAVCVGAVGAAVGVG